jgi:hypothetical protein
LAEEALTVVDELTIPAPKTREMRGVLEALGLASGVLIVVPERDETVTRASANLEGVRAVTPGGLNLLDVLNFRHVLLTRSAAQAVTELALNGAGPRGRRGARGVDTGSEEVTGAPTVEMDEVALKSAAPADLALADAAEEVAQPERNPEVAEPDAKSRAQGSRPAEEA